MSYYVVGSQYADTTFQVLLDPAPTLGPFETHEEALAAWSERARATIDYATVRYQITWRDGIGEPSRPAAQARGAVA